MNNLIYIEKARVVTVGKLATGTNNNGAWASIPVKVEWEYPYTNPNQLGTAPEVRMGKMTAVVVFRQEWATWAKDNVKAGNPFNQTPDCYLNLWLRLWGDIETGRRQDGTTWEMARNNVAVESAEIWKPTA